LPVERVDIALRSRFNEFLVEFLSAKLVKGATLKVYKGASHGMCTTQKDEVNVDLLAFIKG